MMRSACWPALGLLLLAGCDSPPATPESQIEKLTSPRFREREAAAKWLREHPDESLPLLRKHLQHPDQDARRRIEKLVAELERELSLRPSRVTLSVKDAPVSEVLCEIEKQTGNRVRLDKRLVDKSVSLSLSGATFWDAIGEIERQTGYQHHPSEHELRESYLNAVHFQKKGIFRLILCGIYEDRDLTFAKDRAIDGRPVPNRKVRLVALLQVEPRVKPLRVGKPALRHGKDDRGAALRPCDPFPKRLLEENSTRPVPPEQFLELDLARPEGPTNRIAEVSLVVPLQLRVERREVEVPGKLATWKGKSVRLTSEWVRIDTVRVKEKTIQVIMAKDGFRNADRRFDPLFWLKDAGSNSLPIDSTGTSWSTGRCSVEREFRLPDAPGFDLDDLKLFVEEWTVVDVEMPFELKDVPLP